MKSRRTLGQGMTEYVMLVGLVAILMVGAVRGLQASVGGAFDQATQAIVEIGDATASGKVDETSALGRLSSRMRVNGKKPPVVHKDEDDKKKTDSPTR